MGVLGRHTRHVTGKRRPGGTPRSAAAGFSPRRGENSRPPPPVTPQARHPDQKRPPCRVSRKDPEARPRRAAARSRPVPPSPLRKPVSLPSVRPSDRYEPDTAGGTPFPQLPHLLKTGFWTVCLCCEVGRRKTVSRIYRPDDYRGCQQTGFDSCPPASRPVLARSLLWEGETPKDR